MSSTITIEQLNPDLGEMGCSWNVGKYLRSAAIEADIAEILRENQIDEKIVNLICDTVVDHFATAEYLEHADATFGTSNVHVSSYSLDICSRWMTSKEKLLFVGSFIWFLHWGQCLTSLILDTVILKNSARILLSGL